MAKAADIARFDPTEPPPRGICWMADPKSKVVVFLGGSCNLDSDEDCPCTRIVNNDCPFPEWTCWQGPGDRGVLLGIGDGCLPGDPVCGCLDDLPWKTPRDQALLWNSSDAPSHP